MKAGLSIIIPFVGEYPQVLFTIQSTAQILIEKGTPFEIIAVNNYCDEVKAQADNIAAGQLRRIAQEIPGSKVEDAVEEIYKLHRAIPSTWEDRSGPAVKACAGKNSWLKYVEYDERLSHWQSKAAGVKEAEFDTLLFLDAHVVCSGGIHEMFLKYRFEYDDNGFYWDNGTMHFPLTYKILEWRRLIYKLVFEEPHFWSYSFTGFRPANDPYEVPCMSTCGMMIARHIYDQIGGWPIGLGIYGGGENFMNYTLAVTGYKKFIYPDATLYHHGDKRDYHYNYDDMIINRMIAHYLFAGEEGVQLFRNNSKGKPAVLQRMMDDVIEKHRDHRERIKLIQKYTIHEWSKKWRSE